MQSLSQFIIEHRADDPRDLALRQSRYPDIDIPYAVGQIAAWQTAKKKLPLWAATEGIIYPVHLSMEQCSSQLTAEYKGSIVEAGSNFTDLTSGFGVDATMIGRKFEHVNYVERNEDLCDIARNNLPLLGIKNLDVHNADAADVLQTLPHQSLLFLDPARRDEHGGKTVQISDCTPDVSALQDELLAKADKVMIKLSPMLNIADINKELKCVKEIHIVSVDNECKEVLAVLSSNGPADDCRIVCVNLRSNGEKQAFAIVQEEERKAECHYSSDVKTYIYEPNTSIMKAGCFKSLAEAYGLDKLHPSSHLYTSQQLLSDFPGRIFEVKSVYGLKDKALKGIKKANLTVRNFPSTVAELRKRLKLHEGGDIYLFATTLADESKVMIETRKVTL